MALFSQNMLELAVELAAYDLTYEDMVFKFAEHFFYIAAAMNRPGPEGMWDEDDGFYYDLLRLPDGSATRLKVRSMVGLLPLCATTVTERWQRDRVPATMGRIQERLRRMPELAATMHPTGPGHLGANERGIIALLTPDRLRRVLRRCSTRTSSELRHPCAVPVPRGSPAIFHAHGRIPRRLPPGGIEHRHVRRQLNWRGPIWMPVNIMIIRR
jgi:hypothetical protein